jgi:RHS repeat-associated protein
MNKSARRFAKMVPVAVLLAVVLSSIPSATTRAAESLAPSLVLRCGNAGLGHSRSSDSLALSPRNCFSTPPASRTAVALSSSSASLCTDDGPALDDLTLCKSLSWALPSSFFPGLIGRQALPPAVTVLDERPETPTLEEMMTPDGNGIAFYSTYPLNMLGCGTSLIHPVVIAGPDGWADAEFYVDYPVGVPYTVTWGSLEVVCWGCEADPVLGNFEWNGAGYSTTPLDAQHNRKARLISGSGLSCGHWQVKTTVTLSRPNHTPIVKEAVAEFIVCSVKLTVEDAPGFRLQFNNTAGPRRKISFSCDPADLPETLPSPFSLRLIPVEGQEVPVFDAGVTGLRLWSSQSGATGAISWEMWPGSLMLEPVAPILDPGWYEGKDYGYMASQSRPVAMEDLGTDFFLDLNGVSMTGLQLGVVNQEQYEAANAFGWEGGSPFGFVVHDAYSFALDELDLIVAGAAEDRRDPEDPPAPPVNEVNPGIKIPLNGGFEKNARTVDDDPAEDWEKPLAAMRHRADLDPEMRPLDLKWWKQPAAPLLGRVRFDGVTCLDENEEVAYGNLLVWSYAGQDPDPANEELTVPVWSPVLLAAGGFIDIPDDVPVNVQPFYVEGLATGTAAITATVKPAGAPEWVELTDFVNVAVVTIDLDIDSDNDGVIETVNGAEDRIEDVKGLPGKIVVVADGDSDADGVPDFADGFDLEPAVVGDSLDEATAKAKDDVSTHTFTAVTLEIPASVAPDLSKATLVLGYEASDPAEVTVERTATGRLYKLPPDLEEVDPNDPAKTIITRKALRLWRQKKDGNGNLLPLTSRNKSSLLSDPDGSYVAPGSYAPADLAKLGFTNATRKVTLWIEGVKPSQKLGDRRIVATVVVEPDATAPTAGCTVADAVRLTVAGIDFDMDTDNGDEDGDEMRLELERSVREDNLEEGNPGALVLVAEGNIDGDEKTDCDDLDSAHRMPAGMLDLHALEPLLTSEATVKFVYSATSLPPARDGHLRLWWKKGTRAETDYIPKNGAIPLAPHIAAYGLEIPVYAEGVNCNHEEPKDNRFVTVEVDPDGAAGPLPAFKDRVLVRVRFGKAPFQTADIDDGIAWVNALEAGLCVDGCTMQNGMGVVGGSLEAYGRACKTPGVLLQVHSYSDPESDGIVRHGWLELHKERPGSSLFTADSLNFIHPGNIRLEAMGHTAVVCLPDGDRVRYRFADAGTGAATAECQDHHRLRFLRLEREEGGGAFRLCTPEGSYLRFLGGFDVHPSTLVTAAGRTLSLPGAARWGQMGCGVKGAPGVTAQNVANGFKILFDNGHEWLVENPQAGQGRYDKVTITHKKNGTVEKVTGLTFDGTAQCWIVEAGTNTADVRKTENGPNAEKIKDGTATVRKTEKSAGPFSDPDHLLHDHYLSLLSQGTDDVVATEFTYHDFKSDLFDGDPVDSKLLEQVISSTGPKVKIGYDDYGRVTQIELPWNDSPLGRKITYSYEPVLAGDALSAPNDIRPRTVTEFTDGKQTGKIWFGYTAGTGDRLVTIKESTTQNAAVTDAANKCWVVTRHGPNAANRLRGMVKKVQSPDSIATIETIVAGGLSITTTTLPLANPGDSEPIAPISGKTTRSTTVLGTHGQPVSQQTEVWDGAGWTIVGSTTISYDMDARPIQTTNSNNTATSQTWDLYGVASSTGPDGIQTAYNHNVHGEVTSSVHFGKTTTITRDAAGTAIAAQTTAGGLSAATASLVDGLGRTTASTAPDNTVTSYAYATASRLMTATHPNGGTSISARCVDGAMKSTTGTAVVAAGTERGVNGDGSQWTKSYTGGTDEATKASAWLNGGTGIPWTETRTDYQGRTTKTLTPTRQEEFFYDGFDRVNKTIVRDGAGTLLHTTLTEYDAAGNVWRTGIDVDNNGTLDPASMDRITETETTIANGWQQTITKVYAGANSGTATQTSMTRTRVSGFGAGISSETETTDIHGKVTTSTVSYDTGAHTVTTTTTVPGSNSAIVEVTQDGNLISSTDQNGLTTTYTYDALGRRTGTTDSRGNTTTIAYNSLGQVVSETNAAGNTTTYTYDATTGQRICTANALGKTVRASYDLRGNTIRTWGSATYPTETAYDALNHRTSLSTFQGGTGWDGATWPGNTGTATTTSWTYQGDIGSVLTKTDASGTVSYTYTGSGQLATRIWARGASTAYTYDSLGQMTLVDYSDATPDVGYTYDRLGRQATVTDAVGTRTFSYDNHLQLSSEAITGLYTKTIARTYDDFGRLSGTAIAADSWAVGHTYDSLGRASQLTGNGDAWSFTYLANANLLSQISGPYGITIGATYETQRDLLTRRENKFGNTVVSAYDLTNDAIGRRTAIGRSGTAFAQADTIAVTYNDRSEVVNALSSQSQINDYSYLYGYDTIGNRLTHTAGQANPVTTTYTAGTINQYTAITEGLNPPASPAYDADGNMTSQPQGTGWTYTWDGENRLAQAVSGTRTIQCKYDYQGRRVEKRVIDDGDTTSWKRYVYDGYTQIEELDAANANSLKRSYVWRGDHLAAIKDHTLAATYYYLHDANKNVSELVDSTGAIAAHYEYDPFGNQLAATGAYAQANPFRFSNEYWDSDLGLVYYNYRYYSPKLGRWLSRDPIEEQGGDNLYGFVNNELFNCFDKFGLNVYLVYRQFNDKILSHFYFGHSVFGIGHVYIAFDNENVNAKEWSNLVYELGHQVKWPPRASNPSLETFSFHPHGVLDEQMDRDAEGNIGGTLFTTGCYIGYNDSADIQPFYKAKTSGEMYPNAAIARLFKLNVDQKQQFSLYRELHKQRYEMNECLKNVFSTYKVLTNNCGTWAINMLTSQGINIPNKVRFLNFFGGGLGGPQDFLPITYAITGCAAGYGYTKVGLQDGGNMFCDSMNYLGQWGCSVFNFIKKDCRISQWRITWEF